MFVVDSRAVQQAIHEPSRLSYFIMQQETGHQQGARAISAAMRHCECTIASGTYIPLQRNVRSIILEWYVHRGLYICGE